jgi:hypothetical protein
MAICGSSCPHRPRIGPARGLGPHRSSGSLQLSTWCAKSLLGSAGRLVVAAYASASGATSGAAKGVMAITKSAFWECSALPGTSPTHRYDRTCLHLVCAPRASRRDELAASSLQAERWFSAAERETKRRHLRTHNKLKGLIAPRPLRSHNEGVAAGGLEHLSIGAVPGYPAERQ